MNDSCATKTALPVAHSDRLTLPARPPLGEAEIGLGRRVTHYGMEQMPGRGSPPSTLGDVSLVPGLTTFGRRCQRRRAIAAALIVFCGTTTSGVAAEDFALVHRKEIWEMVIASVRFRAGLDALREQVYSDRGRVAPAFKENAELYRDCSIFLEAKFYSRYRGVIDNLDTSPFEEEGDVRRSREDTSILRDPRKIIVEIKYEVSGFAFLKGFHPPAGDFAVEYAGRPELEKRCEAYIGATGLREGRHE
jgi:hypothetical protein